MKRDSDNSDLIVSDLIVQLREDQRCRWLGDQHTLIEHYFQQHPELLADPESAVDLIYSEVLLREELGETIDVTEYFDRFPQYANQLERQFSFHQLLFDDGTISWTGSKAPGNPDWSELLTDMVPGFEILGDLGRGPRGWVCRARSRASQKIVALKIIGEDSELDRQSIRREVERVGHLNHPAILSIDEIGETDDSCFWSMELAAGNLERAILDGLTAAAEAAALVQKLARALATAHAAGIVHGNLKPTNVLKMADGTPKLADFGQNREPLQNVHSGSKVSVGTPAYLAPEQVAIPYGDPTPASDIHALGAILHELMTGQRLYRSSGFFETIERIKLERPAALNGKICPVDLDTIRLKCLEKIPARRYLNAIELADDLERFAKGEPILAKRSSWIKKLLG